MIKFFRWPRKWRWKIVRSVKFEELCAEREVATGLARRQAALSVEVEEAQQQIGTLKRFASEYTEAVNGVQAFVLKVQSLIFGIEDSTGPSEAASTLIIGGKPPAEVLATLINLSEPFQSARPFQYILPFLAASRPFPLSWPQGGQPLKIIDIGPQELGSEEDLYTALRTAIPVELVGFDPFVAVADDGDSLHKSFDITQKDGCRIKTYPILVEDENEVAFKNRYDLTSSILPTDHHITKSFGLPGLTLETVESRKLLLYRLDDVLPVEGLGARVDLLKIDVQGSAYELIENALKVLGNTLVCHVEVAFAPLYLDQKLFADIDILLRSAGFSFIDFFCLGRQRYASFDTSVERAFHRGRTLRGDCIYIRDCDKEGAVSAEELFRAASIMHICYNKQDVAAELLRRADDMEGTDLLRRYVQSNPSSKDLTKT